MKKTLKLVAIMLMSLSVLGLAGCNSDAGAPKSTVEKFMTALKQLDVKTLQTSVNNPDDLMIIEDVIQGQAETMKPLFAAIELTDLTEKIDGETAVVTGKITAVDFEQAYYLVSDKMADVSEADFEKKFAEEIGKLAASKDAPKTTNDLTFTLKKAGDKWLIDTANTDIAHIFGAAFGGNTL